MSRQIYLMVQGETGPCWTGSIPCKAVVMRIIRYVKRKYALSFSKVV